MSMVWILGAGLTSEAIYLYAFFIGDLLNSPIEFLLCHFVLSAIYLPVVYLSVRRDSPGRKFDRRIAAIIGFAVIFRLTLFGMTPTLSDDIYRYVWDGKVLLSGENPYRYPPGAEPIAHLRGDFFDKINHKNIGTPYTPLTELVFASATRFTPPVQMMKLPFIIFDLLTILVLFRLLKILKRSPLAVIVYAWNPLVLFEIAGSGHADSLAVLFLILSLTLLTGGKKVYGSFTFALALLSKYFAAAVFPVMLRRLGARGWLIVLVTLIVFYSPFFQYMENQFIFIHAVASSWRFNDSLFSLFVWITGSDGAALAVSGIIFAGICAFVYFRDGSAVYSAFILIGAMLLLSTTFHPWYLVWIIPFLAIYPSPAWLYLSASVPLSYLLLEGESYSAASETEFIVKAAIYVPFFLLLAARTILGRLRAAPESGLKTAL